MGIVAWSVVGAISGSIASLLVAPGQRIELALAVGIIGGAAGGFLGSSSLQARELTRTSAESVFTAALGAIALVGLMAMGNSVGSIGAIGH